MAKDPMIMEWEDTIEDDGSSFVLLPAGEYSFTVSGYTKKGFPGSAKIPACNKAELQITVMGPDGNSTVKTDLILYRSLEWKLSEFFRSIGQKKHGDRLVMDWSKVPGATGRCKVGVRKWTGRDGEEHESNEILRFLDYKELTEVEEDNNPFA